MKILLAALKSFLFDPKMPLWKYCLVAFPVALIPSLALAAAARFVLVSLGVDMATVRPASFKLTFFTLLTMVVFAPVLETLVLAGLLHALRALTRNVVLVSVASAIAWGCLHALAGAFWFFGTVWSFFVFSCGYQAWIRQDFGKAFYAAAVPHGLINGTAFVSVWTLAQLQGS